MEQKTPEERLKATYRQVIENAYVRAIAHSTGRKFSEIPPTERGGIAVLFEDAIEIDIRMLVEIGEQYRLLGAPTPPMEEEDQGDLVLDSDGE